MTHCMDVQNYSCYNRNYHGALNHSQAYLGCNQDPPFVRMAIAPANIFSSPAATLHTALPKEGPLQNTDSQFCILKLAKMSSANVLLLTL